MLNTPYSVLLQYDNIEEAHRKARKCRRSKNAIVKFEFDLLGQLAQLRQELSSKRYKIAPYSTFKVYEPKPRQIYALQYRDRIVQHLLCDLYLEPYFHNKLIYDNCGCVKGKGQHFAIKRFKGFLRCHYMQHKQEGYFLKCDIKKFYPSLSHAVIKNSMLTQIADKDVKNLFNAFIDSFSTPKEYLIKNDIPLHDSQTGEFIKRGVPIGNQSSQTIGVYYLDPIDRFIKETLRVKHYVRYMDDFILIHHDKQFLQNALKQITEKLSNELKLTLNKKTQIVPIKSGITFLGNRICLSNSGKVSNRIVPNTIRRFKKAIKKFNKKPHTHSIEKMRSTIASYKGHCKHSASRGKSKQIAKLLNVSIKPKPKNIQHKETLELIYSNDWINNEEFLYGK